MVLMNVIKYNASDLNQVKDLLPQYVFEENNVQSLINAIFSINNNYFMKATKAFFSINNNYFMKETKAFNDNLIISFSKVFCNDKLNHILESKLEKQAVTEENKNFIKEFSIVNRYNEMQNTLDKNKENQKKSNLKI